MSGAGGEEKKKESKQERKRKSTNKTIQVPFSGKVETRQPHAYVDMISQIGFKRQWKIVLDPGNGATCGIAPTIYRELLGNVTAINSIPDGAFAARGSEPPERSTRML